MSSSRGDSDGGVKRLKLRNTISNVGTLGAIIGFFINPDAADRAGLKIGSKLLALAKIVRDTPAGRS
jgi:hypothetical protein